MYRFGQEELDAIARVVQSRQWFRYGNPAAGHLQETATFEQELAAFAGVKHACFMTNGTAALMAATAGLQLGPGSECIIPGYTWIASALAPMMMGVIPVIVDVDDTLTISPAAIEAAITPRTRAIYPVHMAGLAADMDAIMALAKKHHLFVIEDACQCDGGLWHDGRRLGSIGDLGAYSFNAFKVISCGEGGALLANDDDTFQRATIFHDAGCNFFGQQPTLPMFGGMLGRANEIMAAMIRVQLTRLPAIIADLHKNRRLLDAAIAPALTLMPRNGGANTGTGTTTGISFADEPAARAFLAAYAADPRSAGAPAMLPIDSGRHVYSNWEVLMEKRGSYHPDLDPFRHPKNAASKIDYRPDMLPATLARLRRTVLISINPDWTAADITNIASAIRAAATQPILAPGI